jgi:hypothetical protein
MKPTLLVAGILAAIALFAGAVGALPVQHHASGALQRPALQALNPQPLPPGFYPPQPI